MLSEMMAPVILEVIAKGGQLSPENPQRRGSLGVEGDPLALTPKTPCSPPARHVTARAWSSPPGLVMAVPLGEAASISLPRRPSTVPGPEKRIRTRCCVN